MILVRVVDHQNRVSHSPRNDLFTFLLPWRRCWAIKCWGVWFLAVYRIMKVNLLCLSQ